MNKKVKAIIDKEISECKAYRDKNEYRENLGYDSEGKVVKQINKLDLDLSYGDLCDIKDYFYEQCDEI